MEIHLYLPIVKEKSYLVASWEYAIPNGEIYQLRREMERQELILSTCSSSPDLRLVMRGELTE